MKHNVLVVGLVNDVVKNVAILLSDALDKYFVDVKDMIEYDLINSSAVEEICGIDYLLKRERSVVKNISRYENAVISINYDLLSSSEPWINFQNNAYVIYIRTDKKSAEMHWKENTDISKSNIIDVIDFAVRDEQLKKRSDYVVSLTGENLHIAVKKILNFLRKVEG